MLSAVVLSAALLALIVGAALVVPRVVQPTVPFGVRVPPDRMRSPVVTAERRRYGRLVLVGCGGVGLAAVLLVALTGQPAAVPLAAFAVLAVWLVAYARAHVAIATAKEREGWYHELRQGVAADVSLRTSPERFPWLWAVPAVFVLADTIAFGIGRYPHLPSRLPVHYGLGGQADAFAPVSVATAFGLVFVQGAVTLAIIAAAWVWLRSRPDLDPDQPLAGMRQHRVWVGRMTRASLVLLACVNVSFFLISWNQWQGGAERALPALGVVLPILVGVVAFFLVALRTPREPVPAGEGGVLTPDDDRHWIGGLIYWNRADPALLVPKRFGVGLTLNLGNPWSWAVVTALVAGVAGFIFTRHRG